MIDKNVRVTRAELLDLLCRKFKIAHDRAGRTRVLTQLTWDCFGSLIMEDHTLKRKFVGICKVSPHRRDFVRINPRADSVTCLSAEIIMFVRISGFTTTDDDGRGVVLPKEYRSPSTNTHSVIFALIRWLSPHPDALLRDNKRRPICPPPLDINHALWKYSELNRDLLTTAVVNRQIMFYPGNNMQDRVDNSQLEKNAWFDLVLPATFETFINCTVCNTILESNVILESITIPF